MKKLLILCLFIISSNCFADQFIDALKQKYKSVSVSGDTTYVGSPDFILLAEKVNERIEEVKTLSEDKIKDLAVENELRKKDQEVLKEKLDSAKERLAGFIVIALFIGGLLQWLISIVLKSREHPTEAPKTKL